MVRLNSTLHALPLVLLFIFSACSDDNEEDLQPQQSQQCDTSAVTYSGTVAPILAANCYSCHRASIAEGGVILDNYAGVKEKASTGHLIGAITHAPGFSPMPQGGPKLSTCDIEKIKKWVDAGALNN